MHNKKGQFYLIAALAIVSIIIGIATVSNSSKVVKGSKIVYEIEDKLEIESEYVLDYGIVNKLNTIQLMENFTRTFTDSSKNLEFYFIFGKEENLKVYKYFNGTRITQSYSIESGNVKTTVNGTEYSFNLTQGENFHYIIANDEGGERYVTTS